MFILAEKPTKPTTESFWQKVALLVCTAILTGIAIPYITNRMAEDRAHKDQQQAASLERQKTILQAQEQLLRDLETTIFDFHTAAAALPWYRTTQLDAKKFQKAADAYDTVSWTFMAKMHALLTRADRLTSQSLYGQLESHQRKWEALDVDLTTLRQSAKATPEQWTRMLGRLNAQIADATKVLHNLASEYSLLPIAAQKVEK